jgi:hypothetical protein
MIFNSIFDFLYAVFRAGDGDGQKIGKGLPP